MYGVTVFISQRDCLYLIEEYINFQKLCAEVNWITPDDIPEEGNFIAV